MIYHFTPFLWIENGVTWVPSNLLTQDLEILERLIFYLEWRCLLQWYVMASSWELLVLQKQLRQKLDGSWLVVPTLTAKNNVSCVSIHGNIMETRYEIPRKLNGTGCFLETMSGTCRALKFPWDFISCSYFVSMYLHTGNLLFFAVSHSPAQLITTHHTSLLSGDDILCRFWEVVEKQWLTTFLLSTSV